MCQNCHYKLMVDSTCMDLLMGYQTPARRINLDMDLLKLLFDYDMPITRLAFEKIAHTSHVGSTSFAEIRRHTTDTCPLLDDSELLQAVFEKSDGRLERTLYPSGRGQALDARTVEDALVMATATGWTNGCITMLRTGLMEYLDDSSHTPRYTDHTLLELSAGINRLDLLQVWLQQRTVASVRQLTTIGGIQGALYRRYVSYSEDVFRLLLSHILNYRREIRLLTEEHEIEYCCDSARTSLLDAHVGCMLNALERANYKVPKHYWPSRKSLYYIPSGWIRTTLEVLELLEEAGFSDISQGRYDCTKETACSPLVYLATQPIVDAEAGRLTQRDVIVRWFISRGANLTETWPGTETTALHCLAWQSARHLQHIHAWARSDDDSIMKASWTCEEFEVFVREEILDGCFCGCTSSGCDFLS